MSLGIRTRFFCGLVSQKMTMKGNDGCVIAHFFSVCGLVMDWNIMLGKLFSMRNSWFILLLLLLVVQLDFCIFLYN